MSSVYPLLSDYSALKIWIGNIGRKNLSFSSIKSATQILTKCRIKSGKKKKKEEDIKKGRKKDHDKIMTVESGRLKRLTNNFLI